MKQLFLILMMVFSAQFIMGVETTKSSNNELSGVAPSVSQGVTEIPEVPTITYSINMMAGNSYRFTAYSAGATSYEWHVQPESNVYQIYYEGDNSIVVIFNSEMAGMHIICRAHNSAGWSEYSVIPFDATF